jgi:DNA invertase Pin-like site-specific DNA recombinase
MTGTKLKTKAESPPENRRLGYARVSTYGQTLDSQLEQLRAAGCTAKIYREKVTGAHNDRRELLKMLKHLTPGDVVTVTRIDRLARSTFDLFAIVKQIVDAKAQFRSLAEPWADTGTSTGRLMIAVLGGLADVERDLIRTRTAEGRSRAQKRGQRMGRKPKLTAEQQAEAGDDALRVLRLPNSRGATAWERVRFRDYKHGVLDWHCNNGHVRCYQLRLDAKNAPDQACLAGFRLNWRRLNC